MKTNLYDSLVILAHFIKDKLGIPDSVETEIDSIVASMQVSLSSQIAIAKSNGYITEDNYLLIDKIEPIIKKQFDMFPTWKLPMGNMSFIVTMTDIDKILQQLKDKAVAEEIICLPLKY